MAATLIQLQAQIERLQNQASKLKDKEKAQVIARIKEAIKAYDLTAADLGLVSTKRAGSGKRSATAAKKTRGRKGSAKKAASAPKYRDDAGNAWSGRGPRPGWIKSALEAGTPLESFEVKA